MTKQSTGLISAELANEPTKHNCERSVPPTIVPNSHDYLGSDGAQITKLRVTNGHPDVWMEYLCELDRQLEDATNPGLGKSFQGPYYTRGQIGGHVQFVCWINPNRQRQIVSRFRSIAWDRVEDEAGIRGLIACKKALRKRTAATPVRK